MHVATRFLLLAMAGITALAADLVTKAEPHAVVVHNYSRTPALLFIAMAAFLCVIALRRSYLVAIGAGLMLGGLAGNAGQVLLDGYATDWIPIGGWLTNVADLSGAVGFICCGTGYILHLVGKPLPPARRVG